MLLKIINAQSPVLEIVFNWWEVGLATLFSRSFSGDSV